MKALVDPLFSVHVFGEIVTSCGAPVMVSVVDDAPLPPALVTAAAIVVVPSATGVATPVDWSIVATSGLLLVHVTEDSVVGTPPLVALAANVSGPPTNEVAGDGSIVTANWLSGARSAVALLRGAGAPVAKSAELTSMSCWPFSLRSVAVVLLSVDVGPVPS